MILRKSKDPQKIARKVDFSEPRLLQLAPSLHIVNLRGGDGHVSKYGSFRECKAFGPLRSRLSFPATEPPDPRRVSEGY